MVDGELLRQAVVGRLLAGSKKSGSATGECHPPIIHAREAVTHAACQSCRFRSLNIPAEGEGSSVRGDRPGPIFMSGKC
jgi:hypothetical protein